MIRAEFDAGRTIQNMLLAAWADGVGSCVVSLPQEARVKELLGIPENHKVQQSIALGYPLEGATPMAEGQPLKDVLASLGRKPVETLLHLERWGGQTPDEVEAS